MQRKPLASVGNQGSISKLPQPSQLKRTNLPAKRLHYDDAPVGNAGNKTMKPPSQVVGPKKPKLDSSVSKTKSAMKAPVKRAPPKPAATLIRSTSMLNVGVAGPATTGRASLAASAVKKTSKRPAWDVKGRLHDMELKFEENRKCNSAMEALLEESNDRISMLEQEKFKVQSDLKVQSSERLEASATAEKLNSELRVKEEALEKQKKDFEREIDDMKYTNEALQRRLTSLQGEFEAIQTECSGLKSTISQISSARAGIEAELSTNRIQLSSAREECTTKAKNISELEQLIVQKNEMIESAEQRLRDEEAIRRKLHNTIQELKGNIRVFCRVRPLLQSEMGSLSPTLAWDTMSHLTFPDPDKRMVCLNKAGDVSLNESTIAGRSKCVAKHDFNFDRVFEPTSTQQEVFEEISQLVQSVLDGYNVCVFAYGQTGSGKTYTMEGPENINDETNVGMIPKAVEQIFNTANDLKSKGWKYVVEVSYLEIYNEIIRDLLGSNDENSKHDIKMKNSKSSEIYVSNLTTEKVDNSQQVYRLIQKARKNRAVAATKCNSRSSRSHSVFQLKLIGSNSLTTEACEGILNLVDLAGSERLKDSCSEGDRLTETKKINSSLSVLGNVIMALANKAEHIPYRNSKLTHLLSNSLGGNSKTLMFVNISPRDENFGETLNSLRFATKVNQCNIGTAQKKTK